MRQTALALSDESITPAVSPLLELGAYEELWLRPKATFKAIADLFRQNPDSLPSDLVSQGDALSAAEGVLKRFEEAEVTRFGIRVHRAGEYPRKLRDAAHPVELLYYQGFWPLVETSCVAVVGTRNPSGRGRLRARVLTRKLVRDGITVVSGLATGIDSEAHTTAIKSSGRTIAVIGTPLSEAYPRENLPLQRFLATSHLVISQVPVLRYDRQTYRENRLFFPERNVTMSALTRATIIVEAGETSGTLIQARAALAQGRKLFILESCFGVPGLTWPKRFEERGAIRVSDYDEFRAALPA